MPICSHLTQEQSHELYFNVMKDNDTIAMRRLCREDLFFLLLVGFKRKDIDEPWLYRRVREVELEPDEHLDLWAREHYKSTIITYAKGIQDILASHGEGPLLIWEGQETTMGIFSHVKPCAKKFLAQIKTELEDNNFLHKLFPDVLYDNPKRMAPTWSLDTGLEVKRKSNPKEKTVEAHGLVDGQPTGAHFLILNYDDVVTKESVNTPEQMIKVTEALRLSYNLGAAGGVRRFIGTRYHFNDTYKTVLKDKVATPRIYPATHDGTMTGRPVFLSQQVLDKKRRDFGPYIFACQMLQDPKQDSAMGFKTEWQKYYTTLGDTYGWNVYIIVDPASEKKKQHSPDPDYTSMNVLALAPDQNTYWLDGVRDRLNLTERTDALFKLVRKWKPIHVGYEKYGLQADIEHIEFVMDRIENYRFNIIPLGGQMPKNDRIRRLVPTYEQGRFYSPLRILYRDVQGKDHDIVQEYNRDEYEAFPVSTHDDILDSISRIKDPEMNAKFPKIEDCIMPSQTMVQQQNKVKTNYDLFA